MDSIGGFIVGTVTEAGKLIEQGEDYDWQAGLFNIANTTAAGAVGETVFGATLIPYDGVDIGSAFDADIIILEMSM